MTTDRLSLLAAIALLGWFGIRPAQAAMIAGLTLDEAPNMSMTTSASIAVGTPTFSVDVRLSSGGDSIDGVQYYLTNTGPATMVYGTNPLTIASYDTPFTTSDIAGSNGEPTAGNQLKSGTGGQTAFVHGGGADYAAVSNSSIATYSLNTSSLPIGMYVITPVFQEMTNYEGVDQTNGFATPGTFTLTVTPEPASMALFLLAGGALLLRRRTKFPATVSV